MDEIVDAALRKWPNVPHCYGWLALDVRGDWYMRDERTQAAGAFPRPKGSRIEHAELLEFIERNYAADAAGAWFFQNGPQRVYVELEAAPWVWRLQPTRRAAVGSEPHRQPASVESGWLDEQGRVFFASDTASASSTRSTWKRPPMRWNAARGRWRESAREPAGAFRLSAAAGRARHALKRALRRLAAAGPLRSFDRVHHVGHDLLDIGVAGARAAARRHRADALDGVGRQAVDAELQQRGAQAALSPSLGAPAAPVPWQAKHTVV